MKSHGKEFIGSLIVQTGTSAPSAAAQGELFYNTGDSTLYVGNGSSFDAVGSGGSGSLIKTLDLYGDDILHVVGGTVYINMQTHAAGVSARVSAYDAIISVQGGIGALTYAVSKNGSSWTSNADPKLAYVEYTAADGAPSAFSLFVKVTDSVAQESSVEIGLLIQDRYGLTGGGA